MGLAVCHLAGCRLSGQVDHWDLEFGKSENMKEEFETSCSINQPQCSLCSEGWEVVQGEIFACFPLDTLCRVTFGDPFWASVNGMWFACECVRHLRVLELIEGSVGWELHSI
jgi:hypothetical protein